MADGVLGLDANLLDSLLALALGELALNLGQHLAGGGMLAVELEHLVKDGAGAGEVLGFDEALGFGQQLKNLPLAKLDNHRGEIGGHLLGGRIAFIQRLGQGAVDDKFQRRGQILADRTQPGMRLVEDLVHQHIVGAGEGKLASHQLIKHDAGGEDVGAAIDVLVAQPLGGHVGDGADQVAGAGEVLVALALLQAGDAEVQQLGCAVRLHKDVGRLHVAVDDVVAMGIAEGRADLLQDDQAVGHRELRIAADELVERIALDFLHHDVRGSVVVAQV
ncbi:MAG: hypothetical protein ABR991_13205, partial [Terracidiphilus sp.]